jgi:hypothetical protein
LAVDGAGDVGDDCCGENPACGDQEVRESSVSASGPERFLLTEVGGPPAAYDRSTPAVRDDDPRTSLASFKDLQGDIDIVI